MYAACVASSPFAALCPPWNAIDRKSTRLNSSHLVISYAVFCLKKKNDNHAQCEDGQRDIGIRLHCSPRGTEGGLDLSILQLRGLCTHLRSPPRARGLVDVRQSG